MTQKSHRLMFRFWLDMFKPEEEELADTIELLKNERSFSKTIRDGIKLITNLRQGKLDVLFELFPWVKAEFMEYMREIQPADPAPAAPPVQPTPQAIMAEQAWLDAEAERLEAERLWQERRITEAEQALEAERQKIESERTQGQKAIQQQLDRLEELLLKQGNQPIALDDDDPRRPSGGEGTNTGNARLKSLDVPQFEIPSYDDDDDLVLEVSKAKGNTDASMNFLKSMQALQSST